MDGYIPAQSLDKLQPSLLLRLCLGAMGPVHEFGHRHDRQADLAFSLAGLYLLEDLPDAVTSALGSDEDAGIEDYSHAGGFHGLRFLTISSTSAAKSGSRTGTFPVSSSCAFASAMHSESNRPRAGSARTSSARITTMGSRPSMTISAPARTRASTAAKSLAASASEMWMTRFSIGSIISLP